MRLRARAARHAEQAEQRQAADRLDIVAIEAELGRKVVSKSELKRLVAQRRARIGGRTA